MSEENHNVVASDFGRPDPDQFKTGAIPSSPEKVARVPRFRPSVTRAALSKSVLFYPKLQMWGNNQYGDCVSAQEAFAKACCGVQLSDADLIAWAGKHDLLNGAMLTDVMDLLAKDPFSLNGHRYGDGPYKAVDYTDEAAVCAAIAEHNAPLNIAIDHSALPSGAGNQMGWYKLGLNGKYGSIDHCVAITGYGPASEVFKTYGATLPASVDPNKIVFGLFTWKTIGIVDIGWLRNACQEMYVRNPTTTTDGAPGPNPIPVNVPAPTVKVVVSPTEVKYGESVQLSVFTENAVSAVVDGQNVAVPQGSVNETAMLLGANTVRATAVGADGQVANATATYNVVAQPTPTPNEPTVSLKTLVIVSGVTLALGVGLGFLLGHAIK